MAVELTIVTPSQIAFQGAADEVQLPGINGELGVLTGHAALLTLARPGVVTVHSGGRTRRMLVGKGVAEVGPQQVTLLVDICEEPSAVDKEAAKAALDQGWADFKASAPGTPERNTAENHIALQQARLSV